MLFSNEQVLTIGLVIIAVVYMIVRHLDNKNKVPACQHKWENTQVIEKEIFRQGIMVKQHTYVQTCRECGKVKGTILP